MGSVAGIDDGDGSHLGSILCGTLDVVAHDNDIGIVADHENGVLEGLTLGATGNLGVGKTDDSGAKPVSGSLK